MTDQKMILATQKLTYFIGRQKYIKLKMPEQLREIWAMLINIISKLFKSKDKFLNVFLSLIANFGCIILIYHILNIYFHRPWHILSLIYLTSIYLIK